MSATTAIEWTDRTWNPVTGCRKVSPGCKHCYAEGVAHRFWATQYPEIPVSTPEDLDATNTLHRPRRFTDVMCHEDRLLEPLAWRKPQKVFVNSMSDLFHEDVPDAFIDQVFAVMALAPQHTFQVLTKRPERMREYVSRQNGHSTGVWFAAEKLKPSPPPRAWIHAARTFKWPLPNVWLGVSVEDQQRADERIPLLLQTPAAVRFISAEPLLAPVNLEGFLQYEPFHEHYKMTLGAAEWRGLDWMIVGGESGPGARPLNVRWVRSLVAQCEQAGIPAFVKQLGAQWFDLDRLRGRRGAVVVPVDSAWIWVDGGASKGNDPSEWPEDLRVREFPGARG